MENFQESREVKKTYGPGKLKLLRRRDDKKLKINSFVGLKMTK